MTEALVAAVRALVGHLVDGSYGVVESMTQARRLSADSLRNAIEGYGRTLVPIPADALKKLDVVEIEGASQTTLHVAVDLWTAEEGSSDLTLELRLCALRGGEFEIEVLDLHVL